MQFINRFRAKASKAKAVQSRIKALDKMESVETYRKRRVMSFSFPKSVRTGHEVVRVEGLRKTYGELVVLPDVNASIYRGDRIGIIGPNGAGKTTLLKLMAGEIEPTAGRIEIGHNVRASYYAQHHAELLHAKNTVFDEASEVNRELGQTRVRTVLGSFLFSGDDVDKSIGVLSGGERARVALAKLLLDPGNLLLLDEPTNHLDLESCESLIDTLDTYDGTMVFVSHNRGLVRRLATKIWSVEEGIVTEYPGNLDDYMRIWRARYAGEEPQPQAVAPKPATAPEEEPKPEKRSREEDKRRKRDDARRRQARSKTIGKLEKSAEDLLARIDALASLQRERNDRLCDPGAFADPNERYRVLTELQVDAAKIEELTMRWETAQEELEAAREAARATGDLE